MNFRIRTGWLWWWMFLGIVLPVGAEIHTVAASKPVPNRIRAQGLVISAKWLDLLPPAGRVNAPEQLRAVYPGQKVAVALIAEGPDRDTLFRGVTIDLKIASADGTIEEHGLKAVAVKAIKAEGADMAMLALNAGGIEEGDRRKLEAATSLVTFGVFQPAWSVPVTEQAGEIRISGTVFGQPLPFTMEPVTLQVRSTADWITATTEHASEAQKALNRYHLDPPPGRLIGMLGSMARSGRVEKPAVLSFFTIAFRENGFARDEAIACFASLDAKTQSALLLVLRLGGYDTSVLAAGMSEESQKTLSAVEPAKDPRHFITYRDPVNIRQVNETAANMDRCWGGWMATGDQSYLRAVVGLLAGAPDFPAYQALVKTQGGQKGLTAAVARGLAYKVAGWSIGAFQRADPLVSDWLFYWQDDPAFPAPLRKELAGLAGNPAFRMK